jgi:quercetin dioxygenase-like cupin family protein
MVHKNLFDTFDIDGRLVLPDGERLFGEIEWVKHPVFEGVWLKHLMVCAGGEFSFSLVKIAPNKKIGSHFHKEQLEIHEVIAGSGVCVNEGVNIEYKSGVVSILKKGAAHEVEASAEGLFLFAKFIPAAPR